MVGGQRRLDFATLQVNCGQTAEVGIYAGNAPNIDQSDEGLALRSDILNRRVIVSVKDPGEKVRGYVWETKYRWPSRIHIWIDNGREDDVLAQRIAASVVPTDPDSLSTK